MYKHIVESHLLEIHSFQILPQCVKLRYKVTIPTCASKIYQMYFSILAFPHELSLCGEIIPSYFSQEPCCNLQDIVGNLPQYMGHFGLSLECYRQALLRLEAGIKIFVSYGENTFIVLLEATESCLSFPKSLQMSAHPIHLLKIQKIKA